MYDVDSRDQVLELKGVPQASPGAPLPLIIATDNALTVAFLVHEPSSTAGVERPRMVDTATAGEQVAVIRFRGPLAHQFGPPNDESLTGHPLATRGLRPYGAYEVRDSSWIRALERQNRVHPLHRPDAFAQRRHFIFTFHDSTFECVAEALEVVDILQGSIASTGHEVLRQLGLSVPAA